MRRPSPRAMAPEGPGLPGLYAEGESSLDMPATKTALITGITGQDGSYLSELLLAEGYQVHGIVRRASTFNTHRLDGIYVDPHDHGARFHLHYGDMTDGTGLRRILEKVTPDEATTWLRSPT